MENSEVRATTTGQGPRRPTKSAATSGTVDTKLDASGARSVWLRGDHDLSTACQLLEQLSDLASDTPHDDVVVDLSAVQYLDTAIVRILGDVGTWLDERGGRLVLRSPSPIARRLLDLCDVDYSEPSDSTDTDHHPPSGSANEGTRPHVDRARGLHLVLHDVADIVAARASIRAWLAPELSVAGVGDVLLGSGEAIANAFEHGQPPVTFDGELTVDAELKAERLVIVVGDQGPWMKGSRALGQGRGISIMGAVMDVVHIDTSAGTRVRMTRRVRH